MKRVTYYFSKFPLVSTTFIQREIYELRSRGVVVHCIANRRPGPGEYHTSDRELLLATEYIIDEPVWSFAAAHAAAVVRRPVSYVSSFLYAALHAPRLENCRHWLIAPVLWRLCRKTGSKSLHVHFAFGAASVAFFCSCLSGIGYSVSIHGSDVLLPDRFLPHKLKRARFIISNCDYHVGYLQNRYPGLRFVPFHIVRIGLDLGAPPWLPAPFPAKLRPLRLLCVGRLVPVKAHALLVRAVVLARLAGYDVECRIIGDGPLRLELEKQIQESGCASAIMLLGQRSEQEVGEEMRRVHTIVLSSLSEGTPMTIIEAMAVARPVIAPRITAIPELVIHGKTGLLFEKGSAEALSAAIKSLYDSGPMLEAMGKAGRSRMEQLHNVQKNSGALMALLGQPG